MKSNWKGRWDVFKRDLPHRNGEFSKRNWGTRLHSLCSYQGKLKPALAYHLIQTFSEKNQTVLDPFSGSGTIPLEASINQRKAIGYDISDMSVALTTAKISKCSYQGCQRFINDLESYISKKAISEKAYKDADEVSFNKKIKDYFEEKTFEEILKARDYFEKSKNLKDPNWCFVFSSMLHILHGNRPYALSRRSHPLTPYAPSGDFVRKPLIKHLGKKVYLSLEAKQKLPLLFGKTKKVDILTNWDKKTDYIDCIITSPPFISSTRFYMTNWMRFWFSGWGLNEFNESTKDYIEVKQKKDISIYRKIFHKFSRVLKEDGVVVFHVGKNNKVNMAEQLSKYTEDSLKIYDIFIEDMSMSERHGIKDKGTTVEHQYMVLTKN